MSSHDFTQEGYKAPKYILTEKEVPIIRAQHGYSIWLAESSSQVALLYNYFNGAPLSGGHIKGKFFYFFAEIKMETVFMYKFPIKLP